MRPFIDAMTERTKLMCFSHVSNISGIALPAEKMCTMARKHGVLSHIDGAQKFETLGQRDDSRIAAMGKTVEFHKMIGKGRIEMRIRFLAAALKMRLKERIPGIKFRTPLKPEFSGGVVVFHVPGIDLNKALDTLYHKHNIGCAVFGGDSGGIRFCPHIYNTVEEIDRAVDAVAS